MSLPPRAPMRVPSLSKISTEPPLPKITAEDSPKGNYADRFKKQQTTAVPTSINKTLDLSSTADFPSLGKNTVIVPTQIKNSISFADKVKQMAANEEKAKQRAQEEAALREQLAEKERLEYSQYIHTFQMRKNAMIPEDDWNETPQDDWQPTTPPYNNEDFPDLHKEADEEDWNA